MKTGSHETWWHRYMYSGVPWNQLDKAIIYMLIEAVQKPNYNQLDQYSLIYYGSASDIYIIFPPFWHG